MDSPPSTARPTWLNQLPDHSIFELNEQEYLEWSQQAAAAAAYEKETSKSTTTANNDSIGKGSLAARFSYGASSTNTIPAPSAWPKPEPPKDSYGLDELNEEYQGAYQGLSCMAVRGQDLYVAVGRQIRYASLEELKMGVEYRGLDAAIEYIDKRQHKVLFFSFVHGGSYLIYLVLLLLHEDMEPCSYVHRTLRLDARLLNRLFFNFRS